MAAGGHAWTAQRWAETGYVADLARSATVIAVDPLGHGESSRSRDPAAYSFPAVADDLLAVLDHLEIESAVWWGYSRGAQLAASVAAEHPERVSKLVAGGLSLAVGPALLDALSQEVYPLMRDQGWEALWAKMPLPEPVRRRFEQTNDPDVIAAVLEGSIRATLDLDAIHAPTLVYAGSEDIWAAALPEDARRPGVSTHIIEGHDHAGAFAAAEQVLPIVHEFLARP